MRRRQNQTSCYRNAATAIIRTLNEPEDNLVCGSEIKGSESERLLGLEYSVAKSHTAFKYMEISGGLAMMRVQREALALLSRTQGNSRFSKIVSVE